MTTRPSTRSGFTLVELLIVMTVIGILVGMLAVAIIPAFRTANEFTIKQEISQLERSVESFKTKYGFYPPSFATITGPADLLPYLNRIAPNHSEGNANAGSKLQTWWTAVGSQIRESAMDENPKNGGADIVFWLSGIAKNKQFPLTGHASASGGWVGFNGGPVQDAMGTDIQVEREVFYDFKSEQLLQPGSSTGANTGSIRQYVQPKGKGETPFLYLDNGSYASTDTAPYTQNDEAFNPSTFQIISAGMDGEFGGFGEISAAGASGTDNLTNFAEGRLERIILGTK